MIKIRFLIGFIHIFAIKLLALNNRYGCFDKATSQTLRYYIEYENIGIYRFYPLRTVILLKAI